MLKKGDSIYIVDNGRWDQKNEILIQKRRFVGYKSVDHSKLLFDGETSMEIATWAVSQSENDATKFAIAYLIKTIEFKEVINKMNGVEEFNLIEQNYPNLILKYIDKVVYT